METYQMKYGEIVLKMTLEEKASLLSGKDFWQTVNIDRLGIPSITLSDGPHGIRRQAGSADHLGLNASLPATCYPTAATMANSWDVELGEAVGRHLGVEAASQGVHILLGPGLNIKRSPLCGRNFEYFSEDPVLSGKMAAAYVRGIQHSGVAACPKHFAANSQELRRMSTDSVMDERTLREIYLTGFEIAVKEGKPKALMSAYNKVNGVYANENEYLLREILCEEWGYQGVVVSDWGGSNDHAAGVKAGSHLEMPGTGLDGIRQIVEAVEQGSLKEECLNQRVDELLDVIFTTEQAVRELKGQEFDQMSHHKMASVAAEGCIVLLKNENQLLPLKRGTRVAVIGDFARQARYQGAGSSMVNPTKLDGTLEIMGVSGFELIGFEQGFHRNGKADDTLLHKAVSLAEKAEVVLLYLGLDEQRESEGRDRSDMKLARNQIQLLEELAKVNEKIVVILSAGSAIEMDWEKDAMAVVHGYLSGQAGAEAMIKVLNGTVCPSGRLSESYPFRYEDTPVYAYYPGTERTCEYREGIYVGYRYYDTAGIPVRYPFGYGLSYTEFVYSDMKADQQSVSLNVTNTGQMDGAEVVQIYVGKVRNEKERTGIFRPKKELKGFQKVFVKTGETVRVEIPLGELAFRYFDVQTNTWEIESGCYQIMAAASLEDIRLTAEVEIAGKKAASERALEEGSPYETGDIRQVSDAEFEKLLGHRLPEAHWKAGANLELNDALCQMKYAKSGFARMIFHVIDHLKKRSEQKEMPDLNILFIYNVPFRGIAKMSGGMVTMKMAEAMVEMVNGHFWKGLGRLISEFLSNEKEKRRVRGKRG